MNPDASPNPIISATPANNITPSRHKPQLSDEAHGAIATRMPLEETALEVDHMILDFLTYQATQTCLDAGRDPLRQAECMRNFELAQDQAQLFQQRHPEYELDDELRFRMKLLQLVALLTWRYTRNAATPPLGDLESLRAANKARARNWIGSAEYLAAFKYDLDAFDSQLPLPASDVAHARDEVLHSLGVFPVGSSRPGSRTRDDDMIYGTSASVSLLDLLPLFMRVTEVFLALRDVKVNTDWMNQAALWMQQACVEQYLLYGADGSDAIDEAFAWGIRTAADADHDMDTDSIPSSSSTDPLQTIFTDVRIDWWDIRETTMDLLCIVPTTTDPTRSLDSDSPSRQSDMHRHLVMLARASPLVDAERQFLTFCGAMCQAITRPVLLQLEMGCLEGMTREETREFIRSCGVDVESVVRGEGG